MAATGGGLSGPGPVVLLSNPAPLVATVSESTPSKSTPRRQHNLLVALAAALRARRHLRAPEDASKEEEDHPVRVAWVGAIGDDGDDGDDDGVGQNHPQSSSDGDHLAAFLAACDARLGAGGYRCRVVRVRCDGRTKRAALSDGDEAWMASAEVVVVGGCGVDTHVSDTSATETPTLDATWRRMVDAGVPGMLRRARAAGAVIVGIAEGARVLGEGGVGVPGSKPDGDTTDDRPWVPYAGVVPLCVHVVSARGAAASSSPPALVGSTTNERLRPLTRVLCAPENASVLSGRGVAIPEEGGALCFADGTLEALCVDAVAFAPVRRPDRDDPGSNLGRGDIIGDVVRARATKRPKLRRTLLHAGAAAFGGAAARFAVSAETDPASADGNRTTRDLTSGPAGGRSGDWPLWVGPSAVARINVERAAQLLARVSPRTGRPEISALVAFTGAGMSAESGMPTFRETVAGSVDVDEDGVPCVPTPLDVLRPLWDQYDPNRYSTIEAFREDPDACWAMHRVMIQQVRGLAPNPGHVALARLQREGAEEGNHPGSSEVGGGLRVCVVTQNVDGLHQAAGSAPVHELHGTMGRVTCLRGCGWSAPIDAFLGGPPEDAREGEGNGKTDPGHAEGGKRRRPDPAPLCGGCRAAPAKPGCTLFGEPLPERAMQAAKKACAGADGVIVVGTSLSVYPAAALPQLARLHNPGAPLVEINAVHSETPAGADVVITARAAEVLPALVDRVLELRRERMAAAAAAGFDLGSVGLGQTAEEEEERRRVDRLRQQQEQRRRPMMFARRPPEDDG